MVPAIESEETDIYWKALNESKLNQGVMCYVNSKPTSTLSFQSHKQFQMSDCINTVPTELVGIDANNTFAQSNEDNSAEDLLILQSRNHSHDSDSSCTKLKKQACSFENDVNDFSQNYLPYKESEKEQLSIFQSRKRSHSLDPIANTTVKKKVTFLDFENDENTFPLNNEESLKYSTMDTEYHAE